MEKYKDWLGSLTLVQQPIKEKENSTEIARGGTVE